VKFLKGILPFIDAVNGWIGKVIPYGGLIVLVLVLVEVIMRYVFNAPSVWRNELTQMVFGVYIVLSGGYLLLLKGHVNVDLVYNRFSPRGKAILDILTFPLFFLFAGMMFIYGGSLALESLARFEHSQSAWNPPIYPIKMAIPIGAALLLLQGIAKLIRDLTILISAQTNAAHPGPEEGGSK